MTVLVVMLALGTCLENWYGEAAARFAVYGAWWFVTLGALLGLNILAALAIRLPWKRQQAGFVAAHVGLLVLLVGCLVSRQSGVEATLGIFEHRSAGLAWQDSAHFELLVRPAQGREATGPPVTALAGSGGAVLAGISPEAIPVAFDPGPFDWQQYARLPWFPWSVPWFPWKLVGHDWKLVGHDQGLTYDRDGIRLEVLDYYADYQLVPIPRLELRLTGQGDSFHGGLSLQGHGHGLPLVLSVQGAAGGPHGMGGRYGLGTRQALPGGQQVNFWMTGSREETAAFLEGKPDGPLGKLGRVALSVGGQSFQWSVDGWKPGQRKPLGTTGLEVELVQEDSRFHRVRLAIHRSAAGPAAKDGRVGRRAPTGHHREAMVGVGLRAPPQAPDSRAGNAEPESMALYADLPLFNQQDYADGVYGTYWRDVSPTAKDDAGQHAALRDAGRPRIDLLQGADQQIYVRTWRAGKLEPPAPLPTDGSAWTAFAGTPDEVPLAVDHFIAATKPTFLPTPLTADEQREQKSLNLYPRQMARVRLTVDGVAEEFWLGTSWTDPGEKEKSAGADLQHSVSAAGRRVEITLRQDVLDLGVDVRLRQFHRILYPGTKNPDEASQYASLVDVTDRSTGKPIEYRGKPLSEQRIAMNAPLDFAQPGTGHTYRLFQWSNSREAQPPEKLGLRPEDGEDLIYMSFLRVASDPGRGLKYAGCILVVAGVFLRYFVRIKPAALVVCLAACVPLLGTSRAAAQETGLPPGHPTLPGQGALPGHPVPRGLGTLDGEVPAGHPVAAVPAALDWSAWRRLPVFHNGRVMPLDSFARAVVKQICGTESPRLALPGDQAGAAVVRRWDAAELLFAWLAEPEQWERTAFLPADDEDLRGELLELPAAAEGGAADRFAVSGYVSPQQVAAASRFQDRLARLAQHQQMAGGKSPRLTGLDRKVESLYQAYSQYRQLTFDPLQPVGGRDRFLEALGTAFQSWNELEQHLMRPPLGDAPGNFGKQLRQTAETVRKLAAMFSKRGEVPLAKIEPLVASLEETTGQLAAQLADLRRSGRLAREPAGGQGDFWRARALLEQMAERSGEVAQLVVQARAALYDDGLAVRLLPAMDPTALEADRYRGEAQPWLSAQTVFLAPKDMLGPYPAAPLGEARQAYQDALDAYRRQGDPEQPARFAAAINHLAGTLRQLGEAIEPERRQLPIREKENEVLDATAYPPGGSTASEVFYNHANLFFWSWIVCAGAVACFALAWGPIREPMFWAGIVLAAAVEAIIITGLALRGVITGWVPLGSMFETIVFVALCLAATGMGFALLPPRDVYARRPVALLGTLLALAALLVAYYVPTFHREIELLKAILRSNYWLAIHVTTIVTGYGEAAMAWGLGNVALGYYLIGRYGVRGQRSGVGDKAPRLPPPKGRLAPPQACAALGPMIYRLLQATVLLLAAGTILGGMWADVSWGRFWGWDPKEVWALISLLAYMIFLHARHAGWASNFNLAVGAVLGFVAILCTWYVVNYVMQAGKHSYGQGAGGGQWVIFAVFAVNLLFLAAAAGRYALKKGIRD
jgi:ABC-type transport system involved in cytochrome c biogenesis permease subunit